MQGQQNMLCERCCRVMSMASRIVGYCAPFDSHFTGYYVNAQKTTRPNTQSHFIHQECTLWLGFANNSRRRRCRRCCRIWSDWKYTQSTETLYICQTGLGHAQHISGHIFESISPHAIEVARPHFTLHQMFACIGCCSRTRFMRFGLKFNLRRYAKLQ